MTLQEQYEAARLLAGAEFRRSSTPPLSARYEATLEDGYRVQELEVLP